MRRVTASHAPPPLSAQVDEWLVRINGQVGRGSEFRSARAFQSKQPSGGLALEDFVNVYRSTHNPALVVTHTQPGPHQHISQHSSAQSQASDQHITRQWSSHSPWPSST